MHFHPHGWAAGPCELRRKSRLDPFGINRPWKCGFHLHGWAAGPWELTTHNRNGALIFAKFCLRGASSEVSPYCGGGGGGVVAPGVIWGPITSPETIISTRRFSLRPAAVLLSATGFPLPKPRAVTLLIETPLSTR